MNSTPSIFSYQVRGLLPAVRLNFVVADKYRQSLALAWLPRVDGLFLRDDPQTLVKKGTIARIPFVSGDCDDEGTLFSLSQLNVT